MANTSQRREAQPSVLIRLRFMQDRLGKPYGRYGEFKVYPCNKGESCPHCQGAFDIHKYIGNKGPKRPLVLIFPDEIFETRVTGERFLVAHNPSPEEIKSGRRELSGLERLKSAFGAKIDSSITPVSVVTLGGMPFRGGSCTAYWNHETDTILIVDYGRKVRSLDIDARSSLSRSEINPFELPYEEFLVQNRDKIVAILVTHQHLDHCGALPYLPTELARIPVYLTPFALLTVESMCKMSGTPMPEVTKLMSGGGHRKVGDFEGFEVTSFPLIHSTPETLGFDIRAGNQRILHFGDFNMTGICQNDRHAQEQVFDRLIAEGKIDLVSFDAVGLGREGRRLYEERVYSDLAKIMAEAPGRVLIAVFASNTFRIKRLMSIAHGLRKSVSWYGNAMEVFLENARRIGYLRNGSSVPEQSLEEMLTGCNDVVFLTGGQAEPGSQLVKMAQHERGAAINLLPNDTIVFCQDPIPGNQDRVSKLVEKLRDDGYTVITNGDQGLVTHVSGHCLGGDLDDFLKKFKGKTRLFYPQHMSKRTRDTVAQLTQQHIPQSALSGLPIINPRLGTMTRLFLS